MDHYTPCLLPKILRSRCFLFLLVDCATQEELETLVRQTFFLEGYGEAGGRGGGGANKGCLPSTKRFRKIWSESKWSLTFWVVPKENFREQQNLWKGSPVFLDRFDVHFFKGIFYTSFRLSLPFFGKCIWFVQMVNEILRGRWPVLSFGTIFPNRGSTGSPPMQIINNSSLPKREIAWDPN